MTKTSIVKGQLSKVKCSHRGFTLLELLLSVAIISLLAGLSLPVYRTLLTKNDLDIAAQVSASSLRRAQNLSQSVDGDITWGTKIQSGSIVMFKGASYAGRDTAYDEIFTIPSSITFSGVSEVVFAKLTGLPQATGTVNLSTENDTRTVTINEKGMVEY
jgi:prepilin-type N-terminal cleavage/methylation domain-containing protein